MFVQRRSPLVTQDGLLGFEVMEEFLKLGLETLVVELSLVDLEVVLQLVPVGMDFVSFVSPDNFVM